MTRRNKLFGYLQSIYIVFALTMASLNCNWTTMKFNWLGWILLASIIPAIVDLFLTYRATRQWKRCLKIHSDEMSSANLGFGAYLLRIDQIPDFESPQRNCSCGLPFSAVYCRKSHQKLLYCSQCGNLVEMKS